MDCPTCDAVLETKQGMRQHHTKVHGDPLPNRTCIGCSTKFYDPKSRRNYCNDCNPNRGSHNGNWKGGKSVTICKNCGDVYKFYGSNKDGVYCSPCVARADGLLPDNPSNRAHRIEVECEYCNRGFEVHRSRAKSKTYGTFCSVDCYGEWLSENVVGKSHHQWKGGNIIYGRGWWEVRRKALERDDYECQLCGKSSVELDRNPDVHHIEPVRSFNKPNEAHELENVICLCRSCHRTVESGTIEVPKEKVKHL